MMLRSMIYTLTITLDQSAREDSLSYGKWKAYEPEQTSWMIFFLISSTENKRLSELEIKLENLKIQIEELKTKLQCFEENKRLRK